MSGQTTNGAGPAQAANGAGPASRYQSALDHPVGAGTFVDRNSLTSPPEVNREPDQTDSREQAVLMRAFTQANATLAAAQERLGADGVAVVNAYQKAHAAVAAVERFTIGETSQHAQGKVAVVRTRHAQDGPESRSAGRGSGVCSPSSPASAAGRSTRSSSAPSSGGSSASPRTR